MQSNKPRLRRSRLSAALLAALLVPAAGAAFAQSNDQNQDQTAQQQANQDQNKKDVTNLKRVVVTGSLIPQSELETSTPVVIITAEDIQSRAFADVHDVLQQSSFATGRVQNNASSASFTQGAETLSLFGLPVGYVKYLINGIPMANYPALYNGSDAFNNISGIPASLVERIEILPGGQSSLYGSDAIAGVVNIILKKQMDGGEVGARYGFYDHGGGTSKRVSAGYGFGGMDDRFKLLVGAQWEKRDPVWGYQRDLTSQFNQHGYSEPIASRDYLVYGYRNMGDMFLSDFGYLFSDPNGCDNVTSQFDNTEGFRTRPGSGDYCGSFFTPGYRTLMNGKDSKQVYLHGTFDVNDNLQLYGNVLYNKERVKYHIGSNYTWWGTGVKWGYYYDPDADALLNLQRAFAPEDMGPGGFKNTMSVNDTESYRVRLGARGTFGDSTWDYDVSLSRSHYALDETGMERLADPINDYFQNKVLGPQLGWDPYFGNYPVFRPDYAAFYQPMDPSDFYSFMSPVTNHSETHNDLLRAQITNGYLFSLPGGDAGIAVAAELGRIGWQQNPDPRYLNGEIWGTTSTAGAGDRHRYALTTELRLPVVDMLTLTASGRYDNYTVAGTDVNAPTYNLGFEFRPFRSLLIRGKYGTAFKVPTLADEFQAESGFYTFVTDYLTCYEEYGVDPANAADDCPSPYNSYQIFGTQSGNPELQPIDADTWNVGVVWAPVANFSVNVDYYDWQLTNEVAGQSLGGLLRDELDCFTGELDPNSATCQQATGQITRDPATGDLDTIHITKVNVAKRELNAVVAGLNYRLDAGTIGQFMFRGSYTKMLKHEYTPLPGDEPLDLVDDPYNSTDPKSSANGSVTWVKNRWSTTLYANYIGHTPNNIAWIDSDRYAAPGAGKLDPYTTLNLSIGFEPTEDLSLAFRISNLLDTMPDMDVGSYSGSVGAPYNSANFSVMGRGFYVQANWKFGND
ncbi:MAG TPA: TonB-dependent receptor [Rhodanobacteraceae bacterium]|nr:TonB-dependent receptor [Rhodanobacteraceae bacterium]